MKLVFLMILLGSFSLPVFAAKKKEIQYRKSQTLDFSESASIDGQVRVPAGELIIDKSKSEFVEKFLIKKDYEKEMKAIIYYLK